MKITSVVLVVYFGLASCGREFKWECKGKPIQNIEDFYASRDKCIADGVVGTFCQAVCRWKDLRMLDHFGNLNEAVILNRVENHLSGEDALEMQGKFKKCIDTFKGSVKRLEHGPDTKGNNPAGCLARYFPFWTCIWVSAMSVCQSGFDPEIIGSNDIKMDSMIPTS